MSPANISHLLPTDEPPSVRWDDLRFLHFDLCTDQVTSKINRPTV